MMLDLAFLSFGCLRSQNLINDGSELHVNEYSKSPLILLTVIVKSVEPSASKSLVENSPHIMALWCFPITDVLL